MEDENVYYVYAWIRNDTKEIFYIGKGKNNRINDLSMRNRYFLNVVNKVGIDNITKKKIVENISEEKAFELEKYYIKYYTEQGIKLTNMTSGGEGSGDWWKYLSEEEKQKHREISKSFSGRKHTEETKEKIRKAHLGKDFKTEEGHKRLSEFAKNRPVWFKGKHHTEQTKELLRQQHLGKPSPNAKKVLIINKNNEIINEVRSRNQTFIEYSDIKESNIRKCLETNSKQKEIYFLHNYDYTFIYEQDYLTKTCIDYRNDAI